MRFFRAAWMLLAAAAWAAAADAIPTELFPPDTQIVVSFSLRSLLNSPLLHEMFSDKAKLNTGFGAAMPLLGVDPLKDLDTIVWATSGEQNAPGLAVLRGRFPVGHVKGATMYHGVPLFPDPKNPKATFALLDGETAIVGPRAELQAAIDRRGGAPVLKPALAGRIAELTGRYDFWSVGRTTKGSWSTSPAAKGLPPIDSFELAATLQDGLRFHGEMSLRKPGDATQLQSSLQTLGAMMNANSSSGGSKFDLHAERGRLELNLFVPEAELRKALAAQKDSLAKLVQGGIGAGMSGLNSAGMAASSGPSRSPVSHPADSPGKIVNNERGETLSVTLPSGHN